MLHMASTPTVRLTSCLRLYAGSRSAAGSPSWRSCCSCTCSSSAAYPCLWGVDAWNWFAWSLWWQDSPGCTPFSGCRSSPRWRFFCLRSWHSRPRTSAQVRWDRCWTWAQRRAPLRWISDPRPCTPPKAGGLDHLFRRINFSIPGHGMWFLKNCISFSWSEEIIVIG